MIAVVCWSQEHGRGVIECKIMVVPESRLVILNWVCSGKTGVKKWDYLPRPRYGLSLRCFCHGRTVTTVSLWGSLSPGVLQPILLLTLGGFKLETYKEIIMSIRPTVVEAHSCLSHKKALFPIVVKFMTLVGIYNRMNYFYMDSKALIESWLSGWRTSDYW